MKISKDIFFTQFKASFNYAKARKYLNKIVKEENEILNSLKSKYKNQFDKKLILKINKFKKIFIIGMGGSILGSKAIYNFLKKKNNKEFTFIDNLNLGINKNNKKKKLNLVISKSGNTLETISNFNVLLGKKDKNIFITENKNSYLLKLANELKADIVHHNNYIGGRYSVLSEVGMLPAELMGFESKKFRKFNYLIKNKNFLDAIVVNVVNQLNLIKNNKINSVILNYDEKSNDLLNWYQQLVGESLGKKNKGIFPIISNMPKDNHSLMQFYLDGPKNNYFTFFYVKEKFSKKIVNKFIYKSHDYLKNKDLNRILYSQLLATQKVFNQKKIPYRGFIIENRNEGSIGELFSFFILEIILLGKLLKVNPFNQPSVELIKNETYKILLKS